MTHNEIKFFFILFLHLICIFSICKSEKRKECHRCSFEEPSTGTLKCSGFNITDSMLNVDCLNTDQRKLVDNLIIENSTILSLDLNFIERNNLTALSGIGIHDCNITRVFGVIPCHLNSLRLSNNNITSFNATLMDYAIEETVTEVMGLDGNMDLKLIAKKKQCVDRELSLGLNDNLLGELPMEVVSHKRLKSLHLSGNPLKCEFIWETVWDHLDCQQRPSHCRSLFADENSTNCQFLLHKLFSSDVFKYNLAQIFDSKISLEEHCFEMNKTCDCHPYNLLRGEHEGDKPTVYLSINCHKRNFTELPIISEYCWELNVSSNYIQDVSRLSDPMYRNVRRLDISNNFVNDLQNFTTTGFMNRFDYLYVNNNKFQKISDDFLNSVKDPSGKGLKLGSQLECECHTATVTKGKLIEIQNSIQDLHDVVCWNLMQRADVKCQGCNISNRGNLDTFLRLTDLKLNEVCPVPNQHGTQIDWVLVAIMLELLAIFCVILKVYVDWKYYQRTGILPWISEKLPSLPCDGILEKRV